MELTLFVDHQCNLRCSYCYTGDKFNRAMSVETMRKAVALALDSRPPKLDVSFFGGEPLLRLSFLRETIEHLEQTVSAMDQPRPQLRFLISTNATLVDDEVVALLAPPRRCSVFVSLDGPPAVHDRYRIDASGNGSFARTVAGLERLKAAGIRFNLLSVFTPDTAQHLGDTLRRLLALQPGKIQLAANYRAEWTEPGIAALRAGLDEAGDVWMDAFRDGGTPQVDPLRSKILTHLKGGLPCPSRCLLAGGEFTVAPSGNLYACGQMVAEDDRADLVIGSVDGGFDDEALGRLQAVKDRVEQVCGGCELRARCQSQCGCRHLALTGQLGEITETLCEIESAMIDQADRVAETLVTEKCEAFIDYFYRRKWEAAPGALITSLRRA